MDSKTPGLTGGGEFARLVERRAAAEEFTRWFESFFLPQQPTFSEWLALVAPVAGVAGQCDWLTSGERGWMEHRILRFMVDAFGRPWFPKISGFSEIPQELAGFFSWLEGRPDSTVVEYCWDLLRKDHDHRSSRAPVYWLRDSGRLSGPIALDHIELALSVKGEGDAMYRWPEERWAVARWERDSQPYRELLGHGSYLVRAAASKTLGELFYGVQSNASPSGAPEGTEMLRLIQERERKTPGVAGAFLHGAHWSVDPDFWSFLNVDNAKAWFLATLRQSDREPDVPHIQSLEFYAHELFAGDAGAIRAFLKMGRHELAVMTATQDPGTIPELLPLLREMASSDDPRVAAAIREYLTYGTPHAGMAAFEEA